MASSLTRYPFTLLVPLMLLLDTALLPPTTTGQRTTAVTVVANHVGPASSPALTSGSRDAGTLTLPGLSWYEKHVELQPGKLHLHWSVDDSGSAGGGVIRMAVVARTGGWVGVGISEVGAMVGSDVVVGWVAGGKVVMTDRFIFNESFSGDGVALDGQQDVHAVAGREWHEESTGDMWTELHFWRKLNTGDCNDRAIREGEHVSLIWALGSTDEMNFHGLSRGGTNLVLVPGVLFPMRAVQPLSADPTSSSSSSSSTIADTNQVSSSSADNSERHGLLSLKGRRLLETDDPPGWLNLTAPTYEMPAGQSVAYICNTFDVPYTTKQHAKEWGVIINSTRPDSVHHSFVYACIEGDKPPTTPNYDCLSFREEWGCVATVAVWNRGELPVVLPTNVGMPFGPGGYHRLMLQVHYTRNDADAVIVDHSGVYFRMAPSLLQYDAGVLSVGPVYYNWLIFIPPQQPAWHDLSVCPGECTRRVLGEGGNVTIFASLMHQHAVGRQMYTQLFRNGTKLLEIHRQDYYDFEFQQFKDLSPGLFLLPGDELRTTCTWDTTIRNETTRGGPASDNEMCINFLLYYPASITQNFGYGCFNACIPSQTQPPGVRVSLCAAGFDNMVWHNDSCDLAFKGHSSSFAAITGCTDGLAPSLASLLDSPFSSAVMTVPATAGSSDPVPAAPCVSTSAHSGVTDEPFSSCRALAGGFSLLWNVTHSGSVSDNVTIAFEFRGNSQGYIAVGVSPEGRMVGSSVVAAWCDPSASHSPQLSQLFLGGYTLSQVRPGGSVAFYNTSVSKSDEDMTIRATVSIPPEMAASSAVLIWSKGPVVDNFIAGHMPTDSHTIELHILSAAAATSPAGARLVAYWSQQSPDVRLLIPAVALLVVFLAMRRIVGGQPSAALPTVGRRLNVHVRKSPTY